MTTNVLLQRKETSANFDAAANYQLGSMADISKAAKQFMHASTNASLVVAYFALDVRSALMALPFDSMTDRDKRMKKVVGKIDQIAIDFQASAVKFNKFPGEIKKHFDTEIGLARTRASRVKMDWSR